MNNQIEIHEKKYNKDTVEIFSGMKNKVHIDKSQIPVLEAIDNPSELPFLIEEIHALNTTDSLRLGLVRVQVHSELKMHEDLNKYQNWLYVAQTIEKMLWGELLLNGGGKKKEKDNQRKDKD